LFTEVFFACDVEFPIINKASLIRAIYFECKDVYDVATKPEPQLKAAQGEPAPLEAVTD